MSVPFVLRVFFRWASRWPIAVVSMDGAYFCRVVSVRPVNGGRNPLCKAVWSVVSAGENSAAWANATKSAGVLEGWLITGAANSRSFCASGLLLVSALPRLLAVIAGGNIHNPSLLRGHCSWFPSIW